VVWIWKVKDNKFFSNNWRKASSLRSNYQRLMHILYSQSYANKGELMKKKHRPRQCVLIACCHTQSGNLKHFIMRIPFGFFMIQEVLENFSLDMVSIGSSYGLFLKICLGMCIVTNIFGSSTTSAIFRSPTSEHSI
jgi:hypothetical protein